MSIWQRTIVGVVVLSAGLVMLAGCSQVPSYSKLSARDFESFGASDSDGKELKTTSGDSDAELDKKTSPFAHARRLEENGPVEEAIQEYKRLTNEHPSEATPFHRLAVLYDKNGQSEKSARHYLTAMHLAPKDIGILCDYGYSRYLQGDLHLAESTLREVITRDSNMKRAHNNLALVLARQGKDQDAIEAFQDGGATLAQARTNLENARKANRLSIATKGSKKIAS